MMTSEKLLQIIRDKNMSQNRLAIAAGISPSSMSQAILGKTPFFPGWRQRVAVVLELPEAEVFPEYVQKEPK